MNKSEFLAALERALAVLDEKELRDIVDEYEQHIDMKTASGLSEEEAIADFGDFKELTAELLEAYHVRADYAEMNGSKETRAADAKEASGKERTDAAGGAGRPGSLSVFKARRRDAAGDAADSRSSAATGAGSRLRQGLAAGWNRIWKSMKAAAGWTRRAFLWCWRQICRPFVWLAGILGIGAKAAPDEPGALPEKSAAAPEQEKGRRIRGTGGKSVWAGIGHGIAVFFRWCRDVCVWCVRMAWNAFCIAAAVSVGLMGVCFLFAFGTISILMIGGYPLTGLVIASLGAAVCFFAAAGFAMTLLWRRKGEDPASGRNVPAGREKLRPVLQEAAEPEARAKTAAEIRGEEAEGNA